MTFNGQNSTNDNHNSHHWCADNNTTALVTSSDASRAPRRAVLQPWTSCLLLLPQTDPFLSLMLSGYTNTPNEQLPHRHRTEETTPALLTCGLRPRTPCHTSAELHIRDKQRCTQQSCVKGSVRACLTSPRWARIRYGDGRGAVMSLPPEVTSPPPRPRYINDQERWCRFLQ